LQIVRGEDTVGLKYSERYPFESVQDILDKRIREDLYPRKISDRNDWLLMQKYGVSKVKFLNGTFYPQFRSGNNEFSSHSL